MRTLAVSFAIVVLIVGGFAAWHYFGAAKTPVLGKQRLVATVNYACNDQKTITASYYRGDAPVSAPNEPPIPNGSVQLVLSDGRAMTIPQTLSADGSRYANTDESLVFWSKGNGTTITEGTRPTYTCIEVAGDTGSLPQAYYGGSENFTIRLPAGYTATEGYTYTAHDIGSTIGGVKFTVPASAATGTNLSTDTYISVERIPNTQQCGAGLFFGSGITERSVTDNGVTYSVSAAGDAAAGNRYDETVYAIPGTNPCIGIRYFIRYGTIGNYPQGTVREFDKDALITTFDAIRRTLTIGD